MVEVSGLTQLISEWPITTILVCILLFIVYKRMVWLQKPEGFIFSADGKPFNPRGKPPSFPLGNMADLVDSVKGMKELCSEKHRDPDTKFSTIYMFGTPSLCIMKAEHVRETLALSWDREQIPGMNVHMNTFLGEKGLTQMDEAHGWRPVRKLIAKAFHHEHLRQMVTDMAVKGEQLRNFLLQKADSGKEVLLLNAFKKATLDVIGLVGFGYDFKCLDTEADPPVAAAFQYLLEEVARRTYSPNPVDRNYTYPNERNKKNLEARTLLRGVIDNLVKKKRDEIKTLGAEKVHDDLLKYMITCCDEDEAKIIDNQILADNLVTMMFGGFDTTSITLSYTLGLLSQNPACKAKVFEEVDRVLNGKLPDYDDVNKLVYCKMVIKECLRLFPPAPLTFRTAMEDIVVGGCVIPKHTNIWLPIYWISRDEDNWNDPNTFDPERFAEGKAIPSGAWIPFSGGQRSCVGERMAMLEAVALLAIVAQKLDFDLKPGYVLEPGFAGVVQNPKDGAPCLLKKRSI
jgi:cytochrome P450